MNMKMGPHKGKKRRNAVSNSTCWSKWQPLW